MHNINYIEVKYGTDKKEVIADIQEEVMHEDWREGGSYPANQLKWHADTIYESYDEAKEAIRRMDNGWYDDHAVLFYHYPRVEDTAKVNKLWDRIDSIGERRDAYIEKHRITNQKAKFIGCKGCGSKVAKEYINKQEICPVCRESLRSETVQAKIDDYDMQTSKIRKQIDEERERLARKNKPVVKWLVKYEYHT